MPVHKPWVYKAYIAINKRQIRRVNRHVPVIVGEWCICNRYADKMPSSVMDVEKYEAQKRDKYREIARYELDAWSEAAGWFYWNYQLLRDRNIPTDETWKESWDLARCIKRGWLTKEMFK